MSMMVLRWEGMSLRNPDVLPAAFTTVYSCPRGAVARLFDSVKSDVLGLLDIVSVFVQSSHYGLHIGPQPP